MRRPPLSDTEFRWFSDWLDEEYGLHFGPEKRDILRSRLEPRRAELGFDTFEQLYFHLKYHPDREGERSRLIPHLTNNESYFFRERPQLDLLRDKVLTETRDRLASKHRRDLRLLSAGCAAGEEPYTLAMIVRESGLFVAPWRFNVVGLDLDPEALERARSGTYTQNAFRRLDPNIRERYFTPTDDGRWQLEEEIRRSVTFQQANLVDGTWRATLQKQDVIFCRNVLIYFGDRATRTVVDSFYEALVPGGFLFLGHAETLSRIPTRFTAVRRAGALCYQRPEADVG
jgi:chemotaxis protein methyltransferase CheR